MVFTKTICGKQRITIIEETVLFSKPPSYILFHNAVTINCIGGGDGENQKWSNQVLNFYDLLRISVGFSVCVIKDWNNFKWHKAIS